MRLVACAVCVIAAAIALAQTQDLKTLEAYVRHSDPAVRRAAVLILTQSILDEPKPQCMESASPTREILSKIRATELDVVFNKCKEAWSTNTGYDPVFPHRPSQYEQLYRFVYVLRKMESLDGFKFENYLNAEQRALSELALTGMALVYTPEYKRRLEALAVGKEPMATWAKDALWLRRDRAASDIIFRDQESNRWAYAAMIDLQNKGLLIGFQFGYGHVQHKSRYEFALATNAAYNRILVLTTSLQAEIDSIKVKCQRTEADRERLEILYQQFISIGSQLTWAVLSDLLRLTFEFDREIRDLGVDASAMRMQIRDWIPRRLNW